MAGYRLYYLDRNNHIIAREEFYAADDDAALSVAASLHESSEHRHAGLMLWQGTRQVFATDHKEGGAALVFSQPNSAPSV
ncbi:MAG TPA: hypothetical protein VHX19_15930 [Stellaceae bacterium]|nr:hypothetical protein [Stellaceae bacterium]